MYVCMYRGLAEFSDHSISEHKTRVQIIHVRNIIMRSAWGSDLCMRQGSERVFSKTFRSSRVDGTVQRLPMLELGRCH